MERTQEGGVAISVYPSPEDGTMVIHLDTPNIAEDENGPLLRLYLNDDTIYENPPYPGSEEDEVTSQSKVAAEVADTVTRYGNVSWTFGDVTSLAAWNDEAWTPDQAEEFLQQHASILRDRLIETGFSIMEDLLSTWTPEGETNGEETVEEGSNELPPTA